ncbi:MAG: FKBP-type peptidyl-prolyl cis-trans isomerase [Muribaculaceae bacterium]|nr:FKBP-type peptidyl-prolyl cis-trans isomerase [Muribaculaceae bacterium]
MKQDYVIKNREWLREKAAEPGVTDLGLGVLAKPLKSGKGGTSPNRNSVVTVHYTGRLINGKTFDSSRSGTPQAFRLRELINGWIVALSKMRPGDRWEVYIPAEQGYGKRSQPGIPGGSTLVFDIELFSVL